MTNFENLKNSTIDEMADFIAVIIISSSCGVFGFSDMLPKMIRELSSYNEMFEEIKQFLESESDNE